MNVRVLVLLSLLSVAWWQQQHLVLTVRLHATSSSRVKYGNCQRPKLLICDGTTLDLIVNCDAPLRIKDFITSVVHVTDA